MALVSTICPECKASIKLDDSKPFGFCLSCGSKIALSTLQQNNSGPGTDQLIANYSQLALNAGKSGNQELAESYCNKIIELDPTNSAAWALKASAAGWQSTLRNIRLNELIQNYITALGYANDETSRNTIRAQAKDDYFSIIRGLLKNELGLFENYPTIDVFSEVCDFYRGISNSVPTFSSRIVEITVEEFYDNLAGETIGAASRTLSKVIRDYNANILDVGDMLNQCDAIAGIAGLAAISSSPAVQINCYDAQLSAKNTKLQVINQYAAYVNGSRQAIDQVQSEISEINSKKYTSQQKIRSQQAAAQKKKNDDYWARNASLRTSLQNEQRQLESEISSLRTKVRDVDNLKEVADLKDEIETLKLERQALGALKFKEKKEKDARIAELEEKLRSMVSEKKSVFEKQIDAKKARIQSITNQLTRNY